jgi:hypothetical protein
MSDYPYGDKEPEPERTPPGVWGRSSTFLLGLAIGAVLGLAATPVGRGALIPINWLKDAGVLGAQTDSRSAPTPAHKVKTAVPVQSAAVVAAAPAFAPPPQLRAPLPGQPLVVGVFGDSMADGLWAGLYRRFQGDKSFELVRFSQASTGLARYEYVDMQEKTQAALDNRQIDVAVLMTGTNDEQGIADHGKVYDFGAPGWRTIYEGRIDALVSLLRGKGVAVYWVGLPRMERKGFDARAGQINAIFAARMAALGVPFIPTAPVTVNQAGEYDDYLPLPSGKKVLMRARDGIHMTTAGYIRIAGPVADRLKADVAAVTASSAGAVTLASEVSGQVSGGVSP